MTNFPICKCICIFFLTIFVSLALFSGYDHLNLRFGVFYEKDIAIVKNDFSEKHRNLINLTIEFYRQQYVKCDKSAIIIFEDSEHLNCGGFEAEGCTRSWGHQLLIPRVSIATKDRDLCNVVAILVHELRHVCEGLSDCYDTWDSGKCWAKDLVDNETELCVNVLLFKE